MMSWTKRRSDGKEGDGGCRGRGDEEQMGRRDRHRGGNLVMLQRLDNAQLSAVRIAEAKARTAVEFRRPTKVLEDAVAGGGIGLRVLTFGASIAEGGVPIVSHGGIVGGIGVSGVASHDDAQVAQAGADALK
jgi:glc operon protein GlcG